MQVQKDIQAALSLIEGRQVDNTQYRKVKPYTEYSLKHFKNINSMVEMY